MKLIVARPNERAKECDILKFGLLAVGAFKELLLMSTQDLNSIEKTLSAELLRLKNHTWDNIAPRSTFENFQSLHKQYRSIMSWRILLEGVDCGSWPVVLNALERQRLLPKNLPLSDKQYYSSLASTFPGILAELKTEFEKGQKAREQALDTFVRDCRKQPSAEVFVKHAREFLQQSYRYVADVNIINLAQILKSSRMTDEDKWTEVLCILGKWEFCFQPESTFHPETMKEILHQAIKPLQAISDEPAYSADVMLMLIEKVNHMVKQCNASGLVLPLCRTVVEHYSENMNLVVAAYSMVREHRDRWNLFIKHGLHNFTDVECDSISQNSIDTAHYTTADLMKHVTSYMSKLDQSIGKLAELGLIKPMDGSVIRGREEDQQLTLTAA